MRRSRPHGARTNHFIHSYLAIRGRLSRSAFDRLSRWRLLSGSLFWTFITGWQFAGLFGDWGRRKTFVRLYVDEHPAGVATTGLAFAPAWQEAPSLDSD